ncbi:MAG: DUF4838 domain-containing protein [Chthoniobacteraceae bacterium]
MASRSITGLAVSLWLLGGFVRASVPIVVDGRAAAVIVTADSPSAVIQYAADELAHHVEKATGVRLAIVTESAAPRDASPRILLGDSRAVRDAGIDVRKLAPEAFVLKTTAQSLIIAGDDERGDPLDADTRAGTLWGTYEWLDRALHVRWLWPGELGTFIPPTTTLRADDADETIPPRFFQRKLRAGLGFTSEHPALGFTPAAFERFSHEQTVFLRRHRMGRSYPAGYGHAFTDWWKKDGAEHPEWFQLREDGKRGPAKPTARFSMCVSNPGLQREIVARWEKKRSTNPNVPSFINACENDILGLCTCAECRAWDGPPPANYLQFYSPTSKMAGSRFVSDRYARFWLGVQQLASKTDPNATVIGYVYFNYFQAPTTDVRLNSHILLGYCPSGGWFPRSAEEHTWMKEQWDGWRKTGAQLFLRTNHLLDGYCMPFVFAHQFADDFQHAVRNGMVATDLDSLTGHWSTQGPNLYLAARLHTRPDAAADEVLAEYYAAFGAAAAPVKAYFDYWETYTTDHREQINQAMEELQASRWRTWAKAAHVLYPPACFAPAEALLATAAVAAADDHEAAARVDFLKNGLSHARLCARVAAQLTLANPAASSADGKAALDELIAFRRAHEFSGLGNFNHLAWVEDLSWKLSDETRKAPDLYP